MIKSDQYKTKINEINKMYANCIIDKNYNSLIMEFASTIEKELKRKLNIDGSFIKKLKKSLDDMVNSKYYKKYGLYIKDITVENELFWCLWDMYNDLKHNPNVPCIVGISNNPCIFTHKGKYIYMEKLINIFYKIIFLENKPEQQNFMRKRYIIENNKLLIKDVKFNQTIVMKPLNNEIGKLCNIKSITFFYSPDLTCYLDEYTRFEKGTQYLENKIIKAYPEPLYEQKTIEYKILLLSNIYYDFDFDTIDTYGIRTKVNRALKEEIYTDITKNSHGPKSRELTHEDINTLETLIKEDDCESFSICNLF